MFETGKLGITERKLEATEALLSLARDEIAILKRQLGDSQKSYKLQATNTGAFWQSAKVAEAKLAEIQRLVKAELGSLGFLESKIQEVLDGE